MTNTRKTDEHAEQWTRGRAIFVEGHTNGDFNRCFHIGSIQAEGWVIADVCNIHDEDGESSANARRLVALWNAFALLSTAEIEKLDPETVRYVLSELPPPQV